MRKFKIALVALLAVPALAACSEAPDAQDISKCSDWENKVCEKTVTYRNATLHCIGSDVKNGTALSCDFERFYRDNPTLAR